MNFKNSVTFVGIMSSIFFFLLPFVYSSKLFYGEINTKYFFAIGFVSFLSLYFSYLLLSKKHKFSIKSRWLLAFIVGTLLIHYFSAFLGASLENSLWSDVFRSSGLFFLSYLTLLSFLLAELFSVRDWVLVRRSIAISTGIFAFLMFFAPEGLGVGGSFLGINFDINGLTFGNNTFAGAYLLIGLIITLIEITRSQSKSRLRKTFIGLFVVQILSPLFFNADIWLGKLAISEIFSNPALILGEARSSSAVAFAVLAYFFGWLILRRLFTSKDQVKKYLTPIWAIVWIIAIFGSIALLFTPSSIVQKVYIEQSTAARLIVWQSGLESFKERPILGWGPENFRLAFTRNFDNRLYLDENIGEIWFDRAHNIFVDTLVSVGILGALSLILLWGYFILVVMRATKKGIIGSAEANLLGVLVFAHIVQLQTAFDTVSTYTLVALVLGYGLWLEKQLKDIKDISEPKTDIKDKKWQIVGGVLVLVTVIGFWNLFLVEYTRQNSMVKIFKATNAEEQLKFIDKALINNPHFEALRLSFASMIKGGFESISKADSVAQQEIIINISSQLSVYEKYFQDFLKKNPEDYRVRMNYAYLLLLKTAFGESGRLEEAREIIENSYVLSPENPLTYALSALVELYSGNISLAKEKMNEGISLNPDIEFSKNIMAYLEKQEEQFPTITIIKLKNL